MIARRKTATNPDNAQPPRIFWIKQTGNEASRIGSNIQTEGNEKNERRLEKNNPSPIWTTRKITEMANRTTALTITIRVRLTLIRPSIFRPNRPIPALTPHANKPVQLTNRINRRYSATDDSVPFAYIPTSSNPKKTE